MKHPPLSHLLHRRSVARLSAANHRSDTCTCYINDFDLRVTIQFVIQLVSTLVIICVCVHDGTSMPLCGCSYALSVGSRCHSLVHLAATPVRCAAAQRRCRTSAWRLVFLVFRRVPSCTRGGWPVDLQPFVWVERIPP